MNTAPLRPELQMHAPKYPERNWALIRKDFPILDQVLPQGAPLAYLDNAASSQMPSTVIEAMSTYAKTIHSNVHRGIHTLSQLATDKFEEARALESA